MEKALCLGPDRLIDNMAEDPLGAIEQVFKDVDLDFLRTKLLYWLIVALSNKYRPFYKFEGQLWLVTFHDNLQLLIEALYSIDLSEQPGQEILRPLRKELKKYAQPISYNPMTIVESFCKHYRIEHARRELLEWLWAGILYNEKYPKEIDRELITMVYEWVLFLIEGAYALNKGDDYRYGDNRRKV